MDSWYLSARIFADKFYFGLHVVENENINRLLKINKS